MAPYGLTTYINLTGQWDELQIERHERFFSHVAVEGAPLRRQGAFDNSALLRLQ